MKVVEQNVFYEERPEMWDEDSVIEFISRIASVCYQSSPKAPKKLVETLIKSGHLSVLEHVYVAFMVDKAYWQYICDISLSIKEYHRFIHVVKNEYNPGYCLVVLSHRVILEILAKFSVGDYFCGCVCGVVGEKLPSIYPDIEWECLKKDEEVFFPITVKGIKDIDEGLIPYTFRFITNRGITHELVRHRMMSYTQESTRYCNYSNGKFGEEITVILPYIPDDGEYDYGHMYSSWQAAMEEAEKSYLLLLHQGFPPEIARGALPHDVKAEIYVTGLRYQWEHIIDLRLRETTGKVHPQMKELLSMVVALSSL